MVKEPVETHVCARFAMQILSRSSRESDVFTPLGGCFSLVANADIFTPVLHAYSLTPPFSYYY